LISRPAMKWGIVVINPGGMDGDFIVSVDFIHGVWSFCVVLHAEDKPIVD